MLKLQVKCFAIFSLVVLLAGCLSTRSKVDSGATPLNVFEEIQGSHFKKVTVNKKQIKDGGLLVLSFESDLKPPFKVQFEEKSFESYSTAPGFYEALVSIPFNSKPRLTKVTLIHAKEKREIIIEVIDGAYPAEQLKVLDQHVNLSKKALEQLAKDKINISKAYSQSATDRLWSGKFLKPIDSLITSGFGNKRMYNGSMKSFHQGTDFRAKENSEIFAPAGGRVVLAEFLYLTGNTLIVDHGLRLFTIYAHMNQLNVRKGDSVSSGQLLGLSGMTGRASGPHLHFGAVLQGNKFDPVELFTL